MEPLLVLTIGQAPRPDLEAELADVLGSRPIEVRGAFDGLTLEEVEALAPIDDPDTLHTRLHEAPGADGPVDVIISKKAVTDRFADLIERAGDRPILVGCTGAFVGLPERPGLLFPSNVLSGLIDATLPAGRRLGVLVPVPEQVELFTRIRGGSNRPVTVTVVRPGQDPTAAATELRDAEVDLVVLDCFGYSSELLRTVREITGVPVLSAGQGGGAARGGDARLSRTLTTVEVDDLAVGAWIIGTGGGGNPHLNHLNVQQMARGGQTFELIDPSELADDAQVAVVSTMGAPLVMQERLQDAADVARAVEIMADYVGRPFDAVMATEIGGSNAFQPLMAAAHLDLPIVDSDAMGRAYPEAQMTSFAIAGLQPWPLALVDPRGVEAVVSNVPTWKWMERASRALTIETGSMAATCKAPRTGAEVKAYGISNSMSFAIEVGATVRRAVAGHEDPVGAVCSAVDGRRVFGGKIVDVDRRATDGFLRGLAVIDGLDEWAGSRVELDFQNEWTVARLDGVPVATVPHLICLLDSVSGEAIGTETARYGQRVSLIGIRAPELFSSAAGLAFVGPRAMGYDLDPVDPTVDGSAR